MHGNKLISWMIFIALSLIWGSSFILMKIGMQALSPFHVASIRILSAGIVLLPFAYKAWKEIPRDKFLLVILSGLLGSFFPAYLFCLAETRIDSSVTAILNALTPLFTIIAGTLFFQLKPTTKKAIGVFTGFAGLVMLPFASKQGINTKDVSYSLLVLVATVCYAINVNLVARHLKQTASLNIAALAFSFLIIPSFLILFTNDYFNHDFSDKNYLLSTFASTVLGIMGTAVASVLFYQLVKKAGSIFASLVTYGIPFVAVLWGLLAGETITAFQIACLAIILAGVYLVNK